MASSWGSREKVIPNLDPLPVSCLFIICEECSLRGCDILLCTIYEPYIAFKHSQPILPIRFYVLLSKVFKQNTITLMRLPLFLNSWKPYIFVATDLLSDKSIFELIRSEGKCISLIINRTFQPG